MTIKVTYNVTDVYMSQSVSPVYINVSYSDGGASGGGVWGSITGTLSNQTDLQTALDLKVPYSGATGNVNIGEYELKAGQVTLDTSPTGTAAVGTIRWNDTTGTSETTLKGGNVIIKNGVDLVARVVNKVSPNTTLTKAAYQAVRVSGAQGQRLAIELAQANNDAGSADTIGLVTETIAPNQEGFIMTVGQLEGINTTGSLQGETWVDGDVLYLSPTTAGAVTNVKPTAVTGHIVVIGYVEYAHVNNGKIYVKVMNGWELDELHNVSIVTPTNNQGLFYNSSNSLWENKTISTALGYTPVPTTRNITINGVTYDLSADRTWTISTGISGSGAAGQVTYWTGASAVSGSNNLFWDAANNRLGIGTNVPSEFLHISGGRILMSFNQNGATLLNITNTTSGNFSSAGFQLNSSGSASQVVKYSATTSTYKIFSANDFGHYNATAGDISLLNDWSSGRIKFAAGASSTSQMTLFANGNLAINSGVTDLGVRFGVVGDTLLRGSGATSATTALTVQNSDATNMWRFLNNGDLLVGTTSEVTLRPNNGTITSPQLSGRGLTINIAHISGTGSGVIINNVNGDRTATSGVSNTLLVQNGFAPTSGTGQFNMIVAQGTINQTGGANGITRGLYVNPTLTAAADWRSVEWSNNSGWGLYGAGTANNYMAGSLSIGNTTVSTFGDGGITLGSTTNGKSLVITSSIPGNNGLIQFIDNLASNAFQIAASSSNVSLFGYGSRPMIFWTNSSERMRLDASGNLGIGITPTVRLHVSGDTILRGSGATSATTALTVQNSSSTNLFTVRNDGFSTFGGNVEMRLDTNGDSKLNIINNTSGTSARARLDLNNNLLAGYIFTFGFNSATTTPYKILNSGDGFIYLNAPNDIAILNDNASGLIKFAAGGSSTAHMTIKSNGRINMSSLPTSATGLASGDLWNDAGTVKIV